MERNQYAVTNPHGILMYAYYGNIPQSCQARLRGRPDARESGCWIVEYLPSQCDLGMNED